MIFIAIDNQKGFVYRNAIQCITMHIVAAILWIAAIIAAVVTCGIGVVLFVVPGIYLLVFSVIGAIESNKGVVYSPPISGQLASKWFGV